VRASGGTCVAVSDAEMAEATRELASAEGIYAAPEGAATLAALHTLRAAGAIAPGERVVLFNTGAGQKYPAFLPTELPVISASDHTVL
jgi:threonine synthase